MSKLNSSNNSAPFRGFLAELINRRVLQIGGAYIASAWLGVEIFNFLFEQFHAPGWAYRLLAIILVVGFPISMVLAWMIQVSESGHWELDHSRGDRKTLAVAIAIGILLTAGLSWMVLPKPEPPPRYKPLPLSLAVLPLTDMTLAADKRASFDRLYRSLSTGLEQSPDLTLVRLEPIPLPEDLLSFGQRIGVESLVSASIPQAVEGVTFEVQMLDIPTGEVNWSQAYTNDSSPAIQDVLGMANELLQAKALPPLQEIQFTGTGSSEAYGAFIDGMLRINTSEAGQLTEALANFQAAIDLDPGYTLAYVGLAEVIYKLIELENLPQEDHQKLEQRAHHAVDMARRLDPQSAAAISLFALELDNSQSRIQTWERALELDPDHVMSYYRYAMQLRHDGNLVDAERLLKRATSLSPMNVQVRSELATVFSLQGRDTDAQDELDEIDRIQLVRSTSR